MPTKHFHLARQVCIWPFFNIERGNGGVTTYSGRHYDYDFMRFWHFPTQFVHDCSPSCRITISRKPVVVLPFRKSLAEKFRWAFSGTQNVYFFANPKAKCIIGLISRTYEGTIPLRKSKRWWTKLKACRIDILPKRSAGYPWWGGEGSKVPGYLAYLVWDRISIFNILK